MGFKGITMNTLPSKPGHILAEDDAAIYQGIIGSDGVFSIGDKFKTTVLSNNKVRVSNGVLSVQGHIGRTEYGDYTDMTIENGVSGQKRNDLIVARYTVGTTEDSFILAVKKGVSGATASDPAVTRGDLYQGAKLRELPLWRIKIEGLSIVKVEPMFAVKPTGEEMERQIAELNSNSFELVPVANGIIKKYHNGFFEAHLYALTLGSELEYIQLGNTPLYYALYFKFGIGIAVMRLSDLQVSVRNSGIVWSANSKLAADKSSIDGCIISYGADKTKNIDTYAYVAGYWK